MLLDKYRLGFDREEKGCIHIFVRFPVRDEIRGRTPRMPSRCLNIFRTRRPGVGWSLLESHLRFAEIRNLARWLQGLHRSKILANAA